MIFPKFHFDPKTFPKFHIDPKSFSKLYFNPINFPKSFFDLDTFKKLHIDPQTFINCILAPRVTNFPFKFLWMNEVSCCCCWLINSPVDRSSLHDILFGTHMFIRVPIQLVCSPLPFGNNVSQLEILFIRLYNVYFEIDLFQIEDSLLDL